MPACAVTRTNLSIGVFFCLIVGFGCKKQEDVQYPPTPPQNYAQPSSTASVAPPPPAASSAAPAPAAATPLDAATQAALDDNLKQRAKKDAMGMKEVGVIFGGVIPEGGHVENMLNMDPGKCYEVLGIGQGGIVELDLEIQGSPVPATIAVDNTSGPEAAIKPCYKNVLPIPLVSKVLLKATRGAGAVAGRVYVK